MLVIHKVSEGEHSGLRLRLIHPTCLKSPLSPHSMQIGPILPQPCLRLFHVVINARADIPKSLTVIGLAHVGAFVGGDVI